VAGGPARPGGSRGNLPSEGALPAAGPVSVPRGHSSLPSTTSPSRRWSAMRNPRWSP